MLNLRSNIINHETTLLLRKRIEITFRTYDSSVHFLKPQEPY